MGPPRQAADPLAEALPLLLPGEASLGVWVGGSAAPSILDSFIFHLWEMVI